MQITRLTHSLCRHNVYSFPRRFLSSSSRPANLELFGDRYETDEITNVTPAIIQKLRSRLHKKPGHPLSNLRSLIESHYSDFTHFSSFPPLVTPYKNFDELSFPKDHPGRSVTDSYYVNKDMMLRTHTSAHEVEVFRRGETKWLLTADVYRRDEIDGSHYPVFHQVEGARIFSADAAGLKEVEEDNERLSNHLAHSNIVIEDVPHISPTNPCQPGHDPIYSEAVAKNLKLSLNSLILKLFGGAAGATSEDPLRVRWIEAYFPFTSPSFEVEVFFRGKWLEILGSGVVRQATLDTAGAFFSCSIFSSQQLRHSYRRASKNRVGVWPRSGTDRYDSVFHPRYQTLLVYRSTFPVPIQGGANNDFCAVFKISFV